ncbi:hypothetical protein [Streptomyces sp. NPDC046942]|uniref:shikimate dehydrogenase family protein n=1 Tax=Streptomyces sp. NPDC046942 TaxID=3155137 RepID=UPI0033C745E2
MPLKRTVVPLLDEASATVRATGTANTVILRGGRLLGENSDAYGMLQALRDARVTHAESACVLGAGATAATALAVLHTLGCPEATVIAREPARTGELENAAERIGIAARIRPWTEIVRHLTADLVVSALPPGAADKLAPLWPSAVRNTLLDVVYKPWPTPLADTARHAGTTVIGGLPMLLKPGRPLGRATDRLHPGTDCRDACRCRTGLDRRTGQGTENVVRATIPTRLGETGMVPWGRRPADAPAPGVCLI